MNYALEEYMSPL